MIRTALCHTLVLLVAALSLPAQTPKAYTSPDNALRVLVLTDRTGESRVQVQAIPQRLLLSRDGNSVDGAHGFVVYHAAWTADSQFFVASTQASGGHQPWAYPILVYSRADNEFLDLGKSGVTAVGDFTLKSADIIQVTIPECESNRHNRPSRPLMISLHQLAKLGHLPDSACAAR
jgi:hypothetical protein